MPSSFTPLDQTKPAGSQTGSAFATSANANDVALWYADLVAPRTWALATAGGTAEEAATWTWSNGTHRVRSTNTWSGGKLTQQVLEVSQDSGATWAAYATIVRTFDASGNVTASSGGGSAAMDFLAYVIAKAKSILATLTVHTSATGASVHGLGTMSTQDATAVNIDGGTIDNTPVGLTTPKEGLFTRASEQFNTYAPGAGAGVTVDWSKGGSVITNSGTNALTFSNVPGSRVGTHILKVSNLNSTTFPGTVNWGSGGKPSVAGPAVVSLLTIDGGLSFLASPYWY